VSNYQKNIFALISNSRYFKAICIKERLNPRKHRKDMPVRYWKYLTEKQIGEQEK
ncbi:DUF4130 domain-containing protein, partial [Paraprevotella clara]|uniref:DUF4130 domain-containing protein n=1 Tax=Paraprevotella clara TaxID=454154 RepID=UPI002670A19A